MSKKRADKNARRRRRQQRAGGPRHLHAVGGPGASSDIPVELDGPGSIPQLVRECCADPHPIALLSGVSSVMSAADPRLADPFQREQAPRVALVDLVDAFLQLGAWETDVLCRVIGHLTTDAALARRIRRGLHDRTDVGPAWLRQVEEVAVTAAYLSTDPLRDADNIVLEVSLPDQHVATVICLVDHNMSGALKDCFAIPVPASEYIDTVASFEEGRLLTVEPLDLADARAMLAPAIEHSLMLWPRPQSESWPGSLALLEHLVGELPSGGQGYPEPESDEEQDALVEEFIASDLWCWDELGHEADTAHLIAWVHSSFLSLGLTRVSPVTVEVLMEDLWLRKSVGIGRRAQRALPEVLRAWTRFLHRRGGIPDELTRQTLQAIDDRATALVKAVNAGQAPPSMADLLAEQLRLEAEHRELQRPWLEQRLGSAQAVADLDADPLPDEELDWPAVPEDLRPRVARLLALGEPAALDMGGVELRTVLRRIVAELCARSPATLAAGTREDRQAAALVWVAGSLNDLLGPRTPTSVADMLASFGLTGTVADRGKALLRALGWRDLADAQFRVCRPDLLVGAKRSQLVRLRDGQPT